jgi:hypothetical protein
VSSTRERAKPGVDASSYNKIFMYRVPAVKSEWCKAGGGVGKAAGAAAGVVAAAAGALLFFFNRKKYKSPGCGCC